MKKEYQSPQIIIETFDLTEHIAAGCTLIAETGVTASDWYNSCSMKVTALSISFCTPNNGVPPQTIFARGNSACGTLNNDPMQYCYTNGSGGLTNLATS